MVELNFHEAVTRVSFVLLLSPRSNRREGFTLVELSIAVVVIGLIVAGILIGQDMIQGARIRGMIAQIESYDQAVLAFRNKYTDLPGDMPQAKAAAFGFTDRSASGGVRGGANGDALIEDCAASIIGGGRGMGQSCETIIFWNDLSDARLIAGGFSTATMTGPYSGVNYTQSQIPLLLPRAKLGGNLWVMITSVSSAHSWLIAEVLNITGICCTMWDASTNYSLTPTDGFMLDSKADDGLPRTGRVTARGTPSFGEPVYTGSLKGSAANPDGYCEALHQNRYNIAAKAGVPTCTIGMRTSW